MLIECEELAAHLHCKAKVPLSKTETARSVNYVAALLL